MADERIAGSRHQAQPSRPPARGDWGRAAVGAAVMLLWLIAVGPAAAGTIRHDVDDSVYTSLAADAKYQAVGRLNGASGTLIAPGWVLTAGHVVRSASSASFTIGGNTYTGIEWFAPASYTGSTGSAYDIGLVRLSATVPGITPATRYTGTSELNKVATYVGYGRTGTGLTGQQSGTEGTKRAGENVFDALGNYPGLGLSSWVIVSDFDEPLGVGPYDNLFGGSDTPRAREYSIATYDSGGGVFITMAGQTYLAGVASFIGATVADGNPNASYGDYMGSTRVTFHNTWINDQLQSAHWTNASGGSFLAGGNWADGAAPGSEQLAAFTIAGTYTVTFADNAANNRIRLRKGAVTFDLGGFTYSLTGSTNDASAVIGQSGTDNASLTIANGTLLGTDAVIAAASGATGQVTVTGAAGRLTFSGPLSVGGTSTSAGGTGTLTIVNGGQASVGGTMRVWSGGTVSISGGSTLTAGGLTHSGTVGVGAGSTLTVNGLLSWTGGSMGGDGAINANGGMNISGTATKTGGGALNIGGPQSHAAGAALNIDAGTVDFNTNAGSSVGRNLSITANNSAAAYFNATQHLAALNINDTATAALAPGAGEVLVASALTMEQTAGAFTGKLDLADNFAIIDYATGASPLTSITPMLRTGFLSDWAGTGIISSVADDAPSLYGIGALDQGQPDAFVRTTFAGEPVDVSSVLMRYTYLGDANLDGVVNGTDFSIIANGYNMALPALWQNGDFNYDGLIDGTDFSILANSFNMGGQNPLGEELAMLGPLPFGAPIAALVTVPEPASLSLMAAAALAGLLVRRGKR